MPIGGVALEGVCVCSLRRRLVLLCTVLSLLIKHNHTAKVCDLDGSAQIRWKYILGGNILVSFKISIFK